MILSEPEWVLTNLSAVGMSSNKFLESLIWIWINNASLMKNFEWLINVWSESNEFQRVFQKSE